MDVFIKSGTAVGEFTAPPSKSMAHRMLICAALSEGVSEIDNIALSDDITATVGCIEKLGAKIGHTQNGLRITGADLDSVSENTEFFCGESGSTLRFLIPIALLTGKEIIFRGGEKLLSRPLEVYEDIFRAQNISFEHKADCFKVKGVLKSGLYKIPGNISSQFISGLLFALPLLPGESRVVITPPIESRPYIDMTIYALSIFGISVKFENENTIVIPGGQKYKATSATVEGDFSNSAFFGALNFLGSHIDIREPDLTSTQGDKVYHEFFSSLTDPGKVIDISSCPDLGPILFALSALNGGGSFTGAKRLRLKESDRISSMAEELQKFGSLLTEENGTVKITPAVKAPEEKLCSHNDHRIAMALSVMLTKYGGCISGAEAVKKSFPTFFDELSKLGIELTYEGGCEI